MTFGEKLKQARQKAALSQEQLSQKLHVSRSAVAKWETDKGMPDIDNLKAVSQLLGVSIDYLLDDGEMLSFATVKQPIDLESFEKTGKCRSKYDAAALSVFPDAQQIYPLIRKKKLSAVEKVLEWTAMPTFGLFTAVDQLNDGNAYYLAQKGDKQFFVTISKEFAQYSELTKKAEGKRFEIANSVYSKAGYTLI